MRKGSIAVTLFWLSAGWLVVALIATGFLLTSLYSRALDTSLTETLEFHIESLAGAVLDAGDAHSEAVRLSDPRFDRPRSGWYWTIRDDAGALLNLSSSVVGITLPAIAGDAAPDALTRTGVIEDAFGTRIRAVARAVSVEGTVFDIMVTGSLSEILALVDQFRGQTFIVLGAVGAMLAIMSAIVARFALRPVGRLSRAVERVREGESLAIEGRYPREIAPLADEVNALLRSNTQIIERARNQVGNLAHGLKTPIAVLRNEAGAQQGALAEIVAAETDKMSGMVSGYLERARLAARTSIVGKRTDAAASLARLVRAMAKIHPDVDIAVHQDAAAPWFRGDDSDFEEMAGNLIDNACKWSRGRVEVGLAQAESAAGRQLVLTIADDGPGLSGADAEKALRRGVRLDEKTSGSGLGLDIVKELVDVYGGGLDFGRAALGGLSVELRLPAARPSPQTRS